MAPKENRNPRIQVHLSATRLQALERYALKQGSRPSTEAALLLSRLLDDMEEQGKIPPPENTTFNDSALERYLKMLANDVYVPDEMIQLLAKETELTEEELKGIRDRLSST